MPIFYQPRLAKNPHNSEANPLYYAQIKHISTLNEKELVNRISIRTGVSEGIIGSVLRDSMNEVVNLVTLGYKVQLPALGLVYLTIRSNGSEAPEDVTANNVKRVSIRLLASSNFKSLVESKKQLVNFSKVSTVTPSMPDDENGSENQGGGSGDDNNPL